MLRRDKPVSSSANSKADLPAPSKHSDETFSSIEQLYSLLEPTNIHQARPSILSTVDDDALRSFASSFKTYRQLGGRHPARTFLHPDIVLFFSTILSIDLMDRKFDDSEALLSVFEQKYAPRSSDYVKLLRGLKMKHSDPDLFDKGAVENIYIIFFCALSRSSINIQTSFLLWRKMSSPTS